jgi:hypothetical protein
MQIVGEETVKGTAIAPNPSAKNIFDQFSILCGAQVISPRSRFAYYTIVATAISGSIMLSGNFVDQQQFFVSESSVYRLLKVHDLIISFVFILIEGGRHVRHRTQPALARVFTQRF